MDENKLREEMGLLKHRIISPVVMESTRHQMKYFCETAKKEFEVPGVKGFRKFSVSTMKGWLNRYRRHGFSALLPKLRSDRGIQKSITLEQKIKIREAREDLLDLSVAQFYRRLKKQNVFGEGKAPSETTLVRFLKSENLFSKSEKRPRKKYEMERFGQLWVTDFMHGPKVLLNKEGKYHRKAILLAIIDDHSRLIVGSGFAHQENTLALENVFKEAVLKYGLPDRLYCDNGSSFSSHYLSRVCAHLGVGLIHSKPYDSPSRGKVERFFRGVRQRFLPEIGEKITLKEINDQFSIWLREDYHHAFHNGINTRPIDRYRASMAHFPLKRVGEEQLEDFFMGTVFRKVNKDATLSYNSKIYEVPSRFIGEKVELRFYQAHPDELYLYENNVRITRVQVVNSRENGRIYRPTPRTNAIDYQKIKGEQNG